MYIRQTRKEEVEEVVEIINAAADFIASQGALLNGKTGRNQQKKRF